MSAKDTNNGNGNDWNEDPQITAYALGELEGADLKRIEELLAREPGARALVEELRSLGSELEAQFACEGDLGLTGAQRMAIESELETNDAAKKPGRLLHMNRFVMAGLAAAASVVGFMVINDGAQPDSAEVASREMRALAKARAAKPDGGEGAALQGLGYVGDDGGTDLNSLEALGYAGEGFSARKREAFGGRRNLRSLGYSGDPALRQQAENLSGETYKHQPENGFLLVGAAPLSTFSVDVDTASYANVRGLLNSGAIPPADSVRIEEFINYFRYDYGGPSGTDPFNVNVEVGSAPWAPRHRLMRIGLQAKETLAAERKASNLVFLLDVSGSMNSDDKLPLLQKALHMLVEELDERDSVAIVVYAGASGLLLPATHCDASGLIHSSIDSLQSGGSTNGGAGIELAYKVAAENYIDGGINRVILGTDGDFNVGVADEGGLERLIAEKAKTGVFLSVLGFGRGNLQDVTMETLADKGNGNYSYIDSVFEARKVLVQELGSTLEVVAKDVKIQVEFNPTEVHAYRLIGYENRMLVAQDFKNDAKDAGEIGAGHRVTALYEVIPVSVLSDAVQLDDLIYQAPGAPSDAADSGELCTVKLRYKRPEGSVSTEMILPVADSRVSFHELSPDTRWAVAVASFAMLLKGSELRGDVSTADILRWAYESLGADSDGYRQQFVSLVRRYQELQER